MSVEREPEGIAQAPSPAAASTLREEESREWPVAPVGTSTARRDPRRVGRYRLLGRIGEGAMGTVHRAIDADLEREVAVKLVRGASTEAARARLLREARALARFSHPNIIAIFDIGIEDGLMYVVMEYRPGRTLSDWLTDEPRDWRSVLDVFVQAARGLMALHAVGLGHHDFKPHNVLLGEDGIPRVLDFGLAKAFLQDGGRPTPAPARGARDTAPEITAEGSVLGTPAYMPPEAWCKSRTDARSDQFSFCVALYEGLYGRRPFVGNNARQVARNIMRGRLLTPPPATPVPRQLWEVLKKGMASTPASRHPSMYALLRELERVKLHALLREELESLRARGHAMSPAVWPLEHATGPEAATEELAPEGSLRRPRTQRARAAGTPR